MNRFVSLTRLSSSLYSIAHSRTKRDVSPGQACLDHLDVIHRRTGPVTRVLGPQVSEIGSLLYIVMMVPDKGLSVSQHPSAAQENALGAQRHQKNE
jgi:hypothetical protein